MLQRELLIVLSLVMAVFLAVAGAGGLAVQKLNETSKKLVVDTLPGLVEAGLAAEQIHENRRLMREMLSPHTAAERLEMIGLVETNGADSHWHTYADYIFEPEDRQNYAAMLLIRSNYQQTYPPFFALVKVGKLAEATAYFNGEQRRLFQSYVASAKTLFEYNVRQGRARGQIILEATRYAPLAVGVLCVLIFIFGLALGLRLALRGWR